VLKNIKREPKEEGKQREIEEELVMSITALFSNTNYYHTII